MEKPSDKVDWPKVERMLSNWWGSEKMTQCFLREISKAAEAGRKVEVTDKQICYTDENGELQSLIPDLKFDEIPSEHIEPQSIEQAKQEVRNGGKGVMFKRKLEYISLEERLHKEPASIFARLQIIEDVANGILDREPLYRLDPKTGYVERLGASKQDACAAVRVLSLAEEIRELWDAGKYEKAAIAMLDLGRETILMPALMFNKPAAGGIRASLNAEEQQKRQKDKRLPGNELLKWYNELRKKHPEDLITTTHEKLSKAIEHYEGKKITPDAVKKRLAKAKKSLGKVI